MGCMVYEFEKPARLFTRSQGSLPVKPSLSMEAKGLEAKDMDPPAKVRAMVLFLSLSV